MAENEAARPLTRKQRERARRAVKGRAPRAPEVDPLVIASVPDAARRAQGDFAVVEIPGAVVVKGGKEVVTKHKVVKNRGGTTIERWAARGDLDLRQVEAVTLYALAHKRRYETEQRVVANWSMVASFRAGTTAAETFVRDQLQAKRTLEYLHAHVFMFERLTDQRIFDQVVLHDEPAGVAGSRLGFRKDGAQAVAKDVVQRIAGKIADALVLGPRRAAAEWARPDRA